MSFGAPPNWKEAPSRIPIEAFTSIAFCANELLSITENAGLMGVPIPKAIAGAIKILKKRENAETKTDHPPDGN